METITHAVYLPTQLYPDTDLQAIVSVVSRKMSLIDAEWTLLDLLEHTESTIHRVVLIRAPGAAPPQIRCSRIGPHEVEILYASERKLCSFARGKFRGLARIYEEESVVTEPECMRKGRSACRIRVTTVSGKNP